MLTPAYYRRSDRKRHQDESVLSLVNSMEPASIDMAAFGKRLSEIITKAVSGSRKRHKSRK
jgi:hypothetical protein